MLVLHYSIQIQAVLCKAFLEDFDTGPDLKKGPSRTQRLFYYIQGYIALRHNLWVKNAIYSFCVVFVIFACSLHFAFWRKVGLGVAAGLVRFYCVLDQLVLHFIR